MKYFPNIFLILLLVGGICSCAHQQPAASISSHDANSGVVASIPNNPAEDKIALQIVSVLKQAGINDYVLAGSSRLFITVSASERVAVTKLLKQDAKNHKYEDEITFY